MKRPDFTHFGVLLFLLASLWISGQPNLDSLITFARDPNTGQEDQVLSLMRAVQYTMYSDPDSSFALREEGERLALEYNDPELLSKVYTQTGILHQVHGTRDSAEAYYLLALEWAEKANSRTAKSLAYNNYSMLAFVRRDYERARELATKSIENFSPELDTVQLIGAYNKLASIEYGLGNYVKSISDYYAALELAEMSGNAQYRILLLNNIGKSFTRIYNYVEAEKAFLEALELAQNSNPRYLISLYYNLGNSRYTQGDYPRALEYFQAGLDVDSDREPCYKMNIMMELALTTSALGDPESAMSLLNRSLDTVHFACYHDHSDSIIANYIRGVILIDSGKLSEGIEELRFSLDNSGLPVDKRLFACNRAAQALYRLSRYREAYEFSQRYNALNDSVRGDEVIKGIASAGYEYQLKQKESQRKQELSALSEKIDASHTTQLVLWTASLIFTGLIIVLFSLYRRQKVDKKILEEKNRTITLQQKELQTKANLLRTSYERIRELSSFKERLAHMAVHDMKNPLHLVMGLSAGTATADKMERIHTASQHMLNFVTNMLDIYKFEQAHIALDLQFHRVEHLIREAVSQVDGLMNEKLLEPDIQVNSGLKCSVDGIIITRVLVNLLTNAIKYSSPGSTLIIQADTDLQDPSEGKLILKVKDFGQGIDTDQLGHLFSEYREKPPQHISKSASTGIGLNFCYLAVKAHHGTIRAESELNRGTTVIIELPLHTMPEGHSPETGKTVVPATKLILDEERNIIHGLAEKLSTIKVFEVGKINSIVSDKTYSELQSKWLAFVKASVYAGEQQVYNDLIETAQNG